ncbi:penicillin-binding transpeptidase domain-containing protein [Nocardia farcinica]|uniref:Penicillin-binding protein A n=1 Tax=Nocardia farcinica TaxID=37329 RepID=A0A449GH86_NOCFR|nr:penicillin-binding transpeptidase domain-containing protein [Nocardia farcinica]MBF6261817.1 penicillin-binding transpeptidase domain-containing protein [Nocardia farcinica]MBF6280356.1 penicillin-binding transpeptidase domain-containing protein [Nocardia farcinica]MBF6305188.1 penicillin-binding transpeptidase domain-containing protein [Nocardia farcinica]MBF6391743.1 penicillin-binding transpeptidase domain-containing protein [Nocardia farcinica]MBF6490828.1 penicillin-binding transpeptid
MSTRILIPVVVAMLVAAAVVGCSSGPQGPVPVAESFLSAFAARELDAAAELTSQPEKASAALASAWEKLQAEKLTARSGAARVTGDTATVDYSYEWRLPKNRVWSYTGQLQMGRSEGRWTVRWTSSNIHPRLGDTQTLALRTTPAPRARVNEQSGSDVLVPGEVTRVAFSPADAPDPAKVAGALSAALLRFDKKLTPEAILRAARAADGPYTVALLSEVEYNEVGALLIGLPGVRLNQEWDMVSTERGFAPDLLTQIRKTVIAEVDGKAGWSVVTQNANGVDTDVLTEVPAQPAPSFALSIDRYVQNAAQRAVDVPKEQTMMVVIRPSTGAILAVAQNEAADRDGPMATIGQYPPGSIFKTVTAAAAMHEGLATPDTIVPCPSQIVIGERTIPNYNMFSVGSVPMATAYERSCNTSFAKLASELPADALHVTAAGLGVGPDYTVVGLPTTSGSVPPAEDMVQRSEDGIGQGKVVVSPFGMALMAATVANGSAPVPWLIGGRETIVDGERPAIDPAVIEGLRLMMRKVITGGTATRIVDQGEVYGKTGEAEVEGGSHSWFVGYRGDIAFATLLVKGGSSDNAVAVTRDMFAALPPEY